MLSAFHIHVALRINAMVVMVLRIISFSPRLLAALNLHDSHFERIIPEYLRSRMSRLGKYQFPLFSHTANIMKNYWLLKTRLWNAVGVYCNKVKHRILV